MRWPSSRTWRKPSSGSFATTASALAAANRHWVRRATKPTTCTCRAVFWAKRTEEGFRTAIRRFGEAVALDPGYSRAWTGLADSYILLYINGHAAPRDVLSQAGQAVAKALSLDDSLADAHAANANLMDTREDADPDAAEAEYRRALALNPAYASAHQFYSRFLAKHKRFDESLREIEIAEELDPVSPMISHARGLTLMSMERDECGTRLARRIPIRPHLGDKFDIRPASIGATLSGAPRTHPR